ncbi:hypothetical protein [Aquisalibacillus elongatus]|uniref:Uncharacterized protein n=1 Tax=Aquisalibacillus elongatus TaxID=485577 RepID=A0A3N5B497_9BACI|nr:hypothetical protein [Aquisalibacillus elongatus]RPF52224.1 hypothetical protein EDC24_2216 [Aquisalibacillus elongatus]
MNAKTPDDWFNNCWYILFNFKTFKFALPIWSKYFIGFFAFEISLIYHHWKEKK